MYVNNVFCQFKLAPFNLVNAFNISFIFLALDNSFIVVLSAIYPNFNNNTVIFLD